MSRFLPYPQATIDQHEWREFYVRSLKNVPEDHALELLVNMKTKLVEYIARTQ